MDKINYLKISLSIFIPLLLFTMGYLKDLRIKRIEKKKERKSLIKFLNNLLIELKNNIATYPEHLDNVSEIIVSRYSESIFIAFDSHTGGIINRLSKIESKELHIAIIELIKTNEESRLFNRIYKEIDYFEDFYKRLLSTINTYQKTSTELKKQFRSGLFEYMNFQASLITNLNEQSNHDKLVKYVGELTQEYLSKQTNDLSYHYHEYLRPISLYIREHHRTEYFANEIIERIKRQQILLDDLMGNALTYQQYFKTNSNELKIALKEVDKIIAQLKKNGM